MWSELNGNCTVTNSIYIEHTASQFRSVIFIHAEQCPSVQPAKGHETKNDRAFTSKLCNLARGVTAKVHKTQASYISAEKYWYFLPLVIGSSGR